MLVHSQPSTEHCEPECLLALCSQISQDPLGTITMSVISNYPLL